MIQSFKVPTDQVAKWAGLMSAVFSLSQCLTGIAWGRASDRFGRKPIILLALTCTMISSVLFGFSKTLIWAFIARSFQGLSNGNVGIIRTAVAELVPQKELQPLAFSIMPLVWTVGSIFGPSFGGMLVNPVDRYPMVFKHLQIFKEFPFALPNLLISFLFLFGITSGFLFLHETLEDKKSHRDIGLMIGSFLTRPCTKRPPKREWGTDSEEAHPFLDDPGSEMSSPVTKRAAPIPVKPTGWSAVFTRQSNINLGVYTILAMHSVAFDQLLPIFMHHPVQSIHDPTVHLPLKFAGGFGISSNHIGVLFTIYGVFGMVIQFAVFPPVARHFGVLNCLKITSLVFPLVYIATPFTSLLPTSNLRQGVMLAIMLVKGFCAIFAFPCSTILLTNSASSLKILGTLNGVATSISAIGRAAGPALAGAAFTGGVDIGYVIISWWTLAVVAVIAAFPVWWLVESEGFGSNDDEEGESDSEVGDEDEEVTRVTGIGLSPEPYRRSPDDVFYDSDDPPEDSAYLTRSTTTRSSQSKRESLDLKRVPSPLGMGRDTIPLGARRYSSGLGATMSGMGTGGTSYH